MLGMSQWNILGVFLFVVLALAFFVRTRWGSRHHIPCPFTMPHSAYLLRSDDPRARYKNRAYIGYNVDHHQRLRQHNGELAGGPSRTLLGRPWTYVAMVTGFSNGTAARIFEWAWANPRVGVSLPWATPRLRRDGLFGGKELFKQLAQATKDLPTPVCTWKWRLQVLAIMLSIPGWAGLNLR